MAILLMFLMQIEMRCSDAKLPPSMASPLPFVVPNWQVNLSKSANAHFERRLFGHLKDCNQSLAGIRRHTVNSLQSSDRFHSIPTLDFKQNRPLAHLNRAQHAIKSIAASESLRLLKAGEAVQRPLRRSVATDPEPTTPAKPPRWPSTSQAPPCERSLR